MSRNVFKSAYKIAQGHVRTTIKDVVENAKHNAENDHEIQLNILKPKIGKIYEDLKEWNNTRSEKSKLSRDEMKEIALGILSETKRAITDVSGNIKTESDELDEFFASLDEEFNLDEEPGIESDSFNRDNLPMVNLNQPTQQVIVDVALSLLFAVDDEKFRNFLAAKTSLVKEALGLNEEGVSLPLGVSESPVDIRPAVVSLVEEVIEEQTSEYTEVSNLVSEIVEEVEITDATANLDLVMATPKVKEITAMESEFSDYSPENIISNGFYENVTTEVTQLLRTYQRNEIFSLTVDRIMTHLNRVISIYASTENSPNTDLEILSSYNLIYMIRSVFGYNILDAVSLYTMFIIFVNDDEQLIGVFNNLSLTVTEAIDSNFNAEVQV
ncbi:MAG: hypothetical protein ACRCX2_28100 [Paraclostridium sp.]